MAAQITPLPSPVPQRSAPSMFSARMDAFLAAVAAFVTQTNTLATEAEADAATAEAQAVIATAQAVLATDAKAVAMAAANYKGPWSSQTGAAAVPYCVSHPAGTYWMLTSNLSNVAAKEPGVASEWVAIAAVFKSGTVTLAGQDGVTVTHNRGSASYLVKVHPTGTSSLGRIGDITYVKAANTVVIYNTGHGGFAADYEISNVA